MISAFRALEKNLREFCEFKRYKMVNFSLGQMLREIIKNKELQIDNEEIMNLAKTRNNLVHAHISVNKDRAVEFVRSVEKLLLEIFASQI